MGNYNYWENEITYLKKVGPKRAQVFAKECGIRTFGDLLNYFPRKYIDRSRLFTIREIQNDTNYVTLQGKIFGIQLEKIKSGGMMRANFTDGTGTLSLVWFQGVKWLKDFLKEGDEVILFGQTKFFGSAIQIVHPEIEKKSESNEPVHQLKILPFYPSTEILKRNGLESKGIRELMNILIEGAGETDFEEILPQPILEKYGLSGRKEALTNVHFPDTDKSLNAARYRLKFEEFFFFQLMLAQRKLVNHQTFRARPFTVVGELFNRFYHDYLPFELTGAQKRVIKEMRFDLGREVQMNRLMQGDVGSGKTMVAFMACLIAADNGFQSAVMAPTEILAGQHFRNFLNYTSGIGLKVEMLSGSTKKKERERIHKGLLSGEIHILVGTHALIEPIVQFSKLGLVVVDEQHKFGVKQRSDLFHKAEPGFYPHNLVMTATPIPRTLGLTLFGDLDVSVIDELPPGRSPVKTNVRSEGDRKRVLGFVKNEIENGRQAYFVYPLVEESEKSDLLAVVEGYEALKRYFGHLPGEEGGYRVGIVHGRQKSDDKEQEMRRFKNGEFNILVSTTVIEVGVDVPNATVMVIENAERFGLSQLHQLRGRVGRSGNQSWCILMAGTPKLSIEAKKRLAAMEETTDGFKISEYDLELRGPGDFLGTRQSGMPEFHLANIVEDSAILELAREAAFALIASDPGLSKSENALTHSAFNLFLKNSGNLGSIA